MVKNPIPWKVRFPERYLEDKRRYYRRNRRAILKHQKEYVKKNRARIRLRQKQYWSERRDKMKAYQDEYSKKPEVIARKRIYRMRYHRKHPNSAKQWGLRNPDKLNQIKRDWAKRNPELLRHYCLQRRSMKLGAAFGNPKDILSYITKLKQDINTICYYCESPLYGTEFHIDHIVPLTRGGLHTVNNLCAACPACNIGKMVKLPDEFGVKRSRITVQPIY